MERSAAIDGFIPVQEMPKSLFASCYDGHTFSMQINPYNGRVVVRYPRDIYDLQVFGKCFALLDSVSFFDDLLFNPERLHNWSLSAIATEEER